MKSKTCSKCGEEKPISQFEARKDSRDGYRQYCRGCKKSQARKAWQKWADKGNLKYWNKRARSLNSKGSRRNGIAGEIISNSKPLIGLELMELYEKSPLCLYCELELTPTKVVFDHKQPLSRKDEHSIGNLSLTCIDCNQLKQARTDEEFRKFLSSYLARFTPIPR
jgi:5-methylcytosine-specific restriction endonuclease McrA